MWNQTTLRFFFILVKMAAIKKITTGRRYLALPGPQWCSPVTEVSKYLVRDVRDREVVHEEGELEI